METLIDRREPLRDESEIVRQGILMRAGVGTISAVEYLKVHGTEGKVITRVLTGEHMREEDVRALAQDQASPEPGS